MTAEGFRPNSSTFSSLLQAFSAGEDPFSGAEIHAQIIKSGFLNNLRVQTSLLGMYSNCGDLDSAGCVFGDMAERDAVAWNSMIIGCMKNRRIEQGLRVYCRMMRVGSVPTHFTFSMALNACSRLGDWSSGKIIHAQIIKSDSPYDVPLQNALVDMYSCCGDPETAFSIFRAMEVTDLVSWNSMIAGYLENGNAEKAMYLFIQLQHSYSETPDEYTYAAIVSATASLPSSVYGKPLHALVVNAGFESSVYVGSTLINMYFKNDGTECAQKLFDSMLEKDVILWTEMISSHSRLGEGEIAAKYFHLMKVGGHKVDSFALSSVLSSSADLATLKQGEMIHSLVVKSGYEEAMCVCGSLIDMYSKNGNLEAAHSVFSRVVDPDIKCWNSLLGGYGHHGNAEQAFKLFAEMLNQGLTPDRVTFISLLSACCHCGLIGGGKFFWNYMIENGLTPGPKHYSCMVTLLSRTGLLWEAEELIKESPFSESFPELWRVLLSSCVVHRELERGVRAAEQVLRFEPDDCATHILLSNLYAAVGRWDAVAEMRRTIKGLIMEKDPGLSWIEIRNDIHVFSAGDESHPQVHDAQTEIQRLLGNMKSWDVSEL